MRSAFAIGSLLLALSSTAQAIGFTADVSITNTDGVTTATPGGSVTYTITASNAGPDPAPSVTVSDTFPASLTVTWTCVGAGGGTCTAAGSGNIAESTVSLPVGGSVTYTATATISASATGTLSNTATVSSTTSDPNPGNNSATDSDSLAAQADLAITKTDGVTVATAGGSVTYTIAASNAGPSNATGATVADTFPASLTSTWTCVGAGGGTCTAAGSGNISDTANLPAGGSVTYTASATVSSSASGSLSNTATVSAPGGVTDPNPANNSATDTDTIIQEVDLAIAKTDGVTSVTAGGSVTYTITASNAGPANATGATVVDTFPASLTPTWTCVGAGGGTCTASGSGNISDTANLPSGGSVTYTASATVSSSASGSLSNTATVSAPGGATDPNPANNSATDTDTINALPSTDLRITKTDARGVVTTGTVVTYTIVATNDGPTAVVDAHVQDTLPGTLTSATWTCTGTGGGTCTASGSSNIDDAGVDLPVSATATWTLTATSSATSGTISNTATIASNGGVVDSNSANNSATDTDTWAPPPPEFDAGVAVGPLSDPAPGDPFDFEITVTNLGPDTAPSMDLTVVLTGPAELGTVPAECGAPNTGLVLCTIPEVTTASPWSGTFESVVHGNATPGADLSVLATISAADDNFNNNTDWPTAVVADDSDTGDTGDTADTADTDDTDDTVDTADTADIDDTADLGDGPGSCGCGTGGSPSIGAALVPLGLAWRRRRPASA